jgi:hypothetical protein
MAFAVTEGSGFDVPLGNPTEKRKGSKTPMRMKMKAKSSSFLYIFIPLTLSSALDHDSK